MNYCREERWTSLFILTLVFSVGKLSQYLFGIVTQDMALYFEYGNKECFSNNEITDNFVEVEYNCSSANNSERCAELGELFNRNESFCIWDYSGKDQNYQILVGPPFTTIFTIAGIIFAMIADRFNRKNVIAGCLLMISVSAPRTGAATAYWELVVYRMILCIGQAAFIPTCGSMISDMFAQDKRNLVLGVFYSADVLSYGMAYFIGHYVTRADVAGMGWHFSYFVTGLISLVAIMLLLFKVHEPDRKCRLETIFNFRVSNNSLSGDYHITNMTVWKRHKSRKCLAANILEGESGLKRAGYIFLETLTIVLVLATSVRLVGSFTWTINEEKYFSSMDSVSHSQTRNAIFAMVGGTLGLIVGGAFSDKLFRMYGIKGRLYVIVVSQMRAYESLETFHCIPWAVFGAMTGQLSASLFATGVLYCSLATTYYCLLGTYFFGEMWYGVILAILLDVIPPRIQATTIAIFIFVTLNIGGNVPALIHTMENMMTYKTALYFMYPGSIFLSSVLFFAATFFTESNAGRKMFTVGPEA